MVLRRFRRFIFILSLRNVIFGCAFVRQRWGVCSVSENRYHARKAAAALLKMAKTTLRSRVAAGLIEAAANLKDQAGELPPQVSIKAPDVQPEGEPPEGAG